MRNPVLPLVTYAHPTVQYGWERPKNAKSQAQCGRSNPDDQLLFLIFELVALGQTPTGEITGTITDSSGAIITGDTVGQCGIAHLLVPAGDRQLRR
jgi:hypothetical protein